MAKVGPGTLVCPACGAAVPKTAAACPYCGAVVVPKTPIGAVGPAERRTFCPRCGSLYPAAVARCPRCPPGPTDERGGHCPRCGADLEATSMGGVSVDRCPSCRGHWFDGDELEHVLDLTTEGVSREDAASLKAGLRPVLGVEDVRYVPCVRCGELMARRQIVPRAGIVVDVCRFHGVWFDGGEMEAFTEFVRAGGLEVLRHEGIAAAELRRKLGEESPPRFASARRPVEGSLARDLMDAVRVLFRRRP